MESIVVAYGMLFAVFCCLVMGFLCCTKRIWWRKKPPKRKKVVINDPVQPPLVCRSVPGQHPYYRIISEYNQQTYDRMPDIAEAIEESSQEFDESTISSEIHPKNFNYTEWQRHLSLTSLPRRCSWAPGIHRKFSFNSSNISSRRSSDSSSSSAPVLPVYKTKATQLTGSVPMF